MKHKQAYITKVKLPGLKLTYKLNKFYITTKVVIVLKSRQFLGFFRKIKAVRSAFKILRTMTNPYIQKIIKTIK